MPNSTREHDIVFIILVTVKKNVPFTSTDSEIDVTNYLQQLESIAKNTKVLLHLPPAKPICAHAHISLFCA